MSIYQPESFYSTTLASAITASQNTIPVTVAPNITAGYLVIEANTSNREIIKYTGVTGTTLTGVVRGLATYGSDDSAGTGSAHSAGVDIANKDVHYYYAQYYDFLTGVSSTGANDLRHGDGNTISADNRFWYVNTSSLSAFWGLSSSGQMVVSEDGVTSYVISAGGSGVTGGTGGIDITAGAVTVNRLSSGGLRVSANKLAVNYDGDTLKGTSAGELYFDKTVANTWSGAHTFSSTVNLSAVSAASCVFSTLPFCETATPTSGSHLTPKNYVDSATAINWYVISATSATATTSCDCGSYSHGDGLVDYTKMIEYMFLKSGKVDSYLTMDPYDTSSCDVRIYINDTAVGTNHNNGGSAASAMYEEALSVKTGDRIQVYLKNANNYSVGGTLKLYYDVSSQTGEGVLTYVHT